jgi:hypothetical protein
MTKFKNPVIGTKIAEYKISTFKQTWWNFRNFIENTLPFPVIFIMILYFVDYPPFDSKWINWIIIIVLSLIIVAGLIQISDKTTAKISGRKFPLYLQNNGIEIRNVFIPFKHPYSSQSAFVFGQNGVTGFKLDSDILYITTESKNHLLKIYGKLNENEIPFKIEPEYLEYKQELLDYLNSQINKYTE